MFSRSVMWLFERVQFTKDACNAASCHVTRSRTRFSREFRARGGDQGTLGSVIAESITRIAINTLFLSTNVPESRELSTRTQRGKLKLSPPFFYTAWTFWCPTVHGGNVKFRTLFREQWDVCNTIIDISSDIWYSDICRRKRVNYIGK